MLPKTRAAVVASLSATALLAACGGNGGTGAGEGGQTGGGEGQTGGQITAQGCQPQRPLIGGDTGESCGSDIVTLFTSTLFKYDPETGEPQNDLAESLETDDNQNFTVTIKDGATFADGSPVTAQSFVDAWNYTANSANGQYLSYFMEPIEGYDQLQAEEGQDPAATEMSGLAVVDDQTFTIKTAEPVANLPVRLGYTAFAPQPQAFFDDPEAFAAQPYGAGPYKVESYEQGRQAVLVRNENYNGEFDGQVDQITFRVYQDADAAFNDLLANNLDVVNQIPASFMVDRQFEQQIPDRWEEAPYPAIQTITFAPDAVSPEYANPKLRQAISRAIDRQRIIDDQFSGSREIATGWTPPGVEGYEPGACGELCEYDADAAKQLLEEAGGFEGSLTLSYNADGDHQAWTTATCNSIRDALGVDCVATPVPDFATFRDQIGAGEMQGIFRTGWIGDYPHIENFLTPMYSKGGSSNDNKYDNPDFDAKLVEAGTLGEDESIAAYQEAEKMLAEDMPSIPLFYYTGQIGWSENVSDVHLNKSSGRPDLLRVTVNQ
ncbi:MAG: ABC transporter substrate-binding protein [Mobilicoccus sp.]|nr:ABC transporter substrate-binding protein [Mobilicoccus sp.]